MYIRKCENQDLKKVTSIAKQCEPMLVQHTDFTYMLLFRYFPEFCSILEDNGKAVGHVVGFRTGDREVAYLWQ
jgi:hypothetical protein